MAKYATFDPSVGSPAPVIGWYDDKIKYTLPKTGVIAVTDQQWQAHLTNLVAPWTVVDGTTLTPPKS